jgi:hypothetical protein
VVTAGDDSRRQARERDPQRVGGRVQSSEIDDEPKVVVHVPAERAVAQ